MAVKLEFEVGPLKLNFRVLLEPKGFLRIIIAFIAILAFATTAGFQSSTSNNTLTCTSSNVSTNYTASVSYVYPYDGDNFRMVISPNDDFITNRSASACDTSSNIFSRQTFYGSAQFYVAMGVFTMLYVIGALIIYILFITPELFMAKYLVIVDLFFTIGFGVLYLLACIAWSAGVAQLNSYVSGRLQFFAKECFLCTNPGSTGARSLESFALPAISLLFGYLATFVWFASVWFVYKDTVWHKDRTGPLAKLYQPKNAEGESQESSPQKANQ